MSRLIVRPLSLLLTVLLASALFAPTADAQSLTRDASMEAGFLAGLNAQRAARGLGPLSLSGSMSQAAANWTAQMVQGSFLAHAGDIVTGAPAGWTKVGENVGRGQSVASLTQSFMNSPSHARNVLDPAFTTVGIAVIVHPSGRVYTTHRFAALPTAAPAPAAPTPAPTPPPAPAPPAPTPAPTAPAPTPPVPEPSPPVSVPTQEAEPAEVAAAEATPEVEPIGPPPEQLAFVAEDAPRLSGAALEKMLRMRDWLLELNDAEATPEVEPIGPPPEQLAFVAEDAPRLSGAALEKMLRIRDWLLELNDA